MEKCSRESIIAAYDNTILYTDHFLNKTIELLKASERRYPVDTAMLYFSDHGESLGEHNLYLHGAPYMISSTEQRSAVHAVAVRRLPRPLRDRPALPGGAHRPGLLAR
ncbi:sulfatase-like hydrolase/transferase [Massilia sp. H-1]|nr:sulfatase-like hydrolase/transferase [Massilia sp. H-1]